MAKLSYGINVGIATLGWCVLDEDAQRIIALNTRAFEAPQDPKTKKSHAATRGIDRRHRRTLLRSRRTKLYAIRLLAEYGLVEPVLDGGSVDFAKTARAIQDKKGDSPVLALRTKALDEILDARELSRLLYWFAGHRGYIPHGEGKDNKEAGKVRAALAANEAELSTGKWRTVGEMLAARGSARNKAGDYALCVSNEMLCDEIRAIFDRQEALGSPLFAGGSLAGLLDAFGERCMQWLTPLDAQEARSYSKVSPCVYFGDEEGGNLKAAAKCCLSFELSGALAALRNVRFSSPGQTPARLPDDVVERAEATLFAAKHIEGAPKAADKVTYKNLRKWAGLTPSEEFAGGPDESKEVFEPKAWRIMRQGLSDDLLRLLRDDAVLADSVLSVLAYTSRGNTIRAALSEGRDLGICGVSPDDFDVLSDDDVEEILGLPYASTAFSGYGTRSTRALRMLCEELEEGAPSLFDAEEALGLYGRRTNRKEGEPADSLPPFREFDPECDNPVVCRAITEARKVINALIREYGRPATIRLDWGRELGASETKAKEINSKNKKREKRRKELREKAAGILGIEAGRVRAVDILKLDLLEEQMGVDAITGEPIDERRMLLEDGYAQIGHALPYSRSMDDSRANKILCRAKTIQDKGDLTCWEWLGDSPAYSAMATRLSEDTWKKSMPKRKRDSLLTKTFAEREGEFIARNLNDDRYAAKRLKEYLESCLRLKEGGAGVAAIPGAIIPKLRFAWGFPAKASYPEGSIMQSATDACVLAACSPEAVRKAAWAMSRENFVPRKAYRTLLADSAPWEGFAAQAIALEARAVPSHAVEHKLKGQLFAETFYRLVGFDEKGCAILASGERQDKNSTFRLRPDGNDGAGSAVLPASHAFLQLWEDPDGKSRTKKTPGCLLPDVVFSCDVEDWLAGRHVPRTGRQGEPWSEWKPIPADILETPSLKLFQGDFLMVKGQPRIYCGFTISGVNWNLANPRFNHHHANSRVGMMSGMSLLSCGLDDIEVLNVGPLGFPEGLPGFPPEPDGGEGDSGDEAGN